MTIESISILQIFYVLCSKALKKSFTVTQQINFYSKLFSLQCTIKILWLFSQYNQLKTPKHDMCYLQNANLTFSPHLMDWLLRHSGKGKKKKTAQCYQARNNKVQILVSYSWAFLISSFPQPLVLRGWKLNSVLQFGDLCISETKKLDFPLCWDSTWY